MRTLALLLLLVFYHTGVRAEEHSRVMLVLDGSGSMWGQIDGVAKIGIAQEVIDDLLDELPEEQELGLTVYGHRFKSSCADIEVLVAPGKTNHQAIRAAVEAIKPKGKTPLTDALLVAADAAQFQSEAVTVVLVTDGLETCDRDPCALARGLKQTGKNFTTHVVGFGVAETDLPGLECVASETGGVFSTANNAEELAAALSTATQPVPLPTYQPKPLKGQFEATDNNGLIFAPLEWTLYDADGEVVNTAKQNQLITELTRGEKHRVVVRKPNTGETAELEFVPTGDGLSFSRTLRFPPPSDN